MNGSIDQAVNRVIEMMYARVGEELTVDELARTAMYSKFHFSRAFREVTGVSPGRFLAALRFQEAKRLLTGTSLSVAEISNQVGYSSLGTFSTRFKSSVGVSPTEYRRSGIRCSSVRSVARQRSDHSSPPVTIRGHVVAAATNHDLGPTVVGLFPGVVPQGTPVRFTVLARPGPYVLEDVPEGTWYILVHGVVLSQAAAGGLAECPTGSVGSLGPIRVRVGATIGPINLPLRPMRAVDLPVVAAPFVAHPMDVRRPAPLAWGQRAIGVDHVVAEGVLSAT